MSKRYEIFDVRDVNPRPVSSCRHCCFDDDETCPPNGVMNCVTATEQAGFNIAWGAYREVTEQ